MRKFISLALFLSLFIATGNQVSYAATPKVVSFVAEVWVDNWFALYVNGKKVGEDSTPFATERSFNSEKIAFKATYPLTIAVIARDYVENASGLEYIGKPNQQIGDGGLIAQIRDLSTGSVVAATNRSWRVFITNRAPLNETCVKSTDPLHDCKTSLVKNPTSWYSSSFKDSGWKYASEFTAEQVGVKDGYFDFDWSSSAKLIWSSDLRIDNTILLRTTIQAPKSSAVNTQPFVVGSPDFADGGLLPKDCTCDGLGISPAITFSGVPANAVSLALIMDTIPGPLRPGEVDIGNHFYLILYDIPPSTKLIPAGSTTIGTLGENFQGKKLGYTPPCSQGSGAKIYTIAAFALNARLDLKGTGTTEKVLLSAMEGKVISKSEIKVRYTRI